MVILLALTGYNSVTSGVTYYFIKNKKFSLLNSKEIFCIEKEKKK